MTDKVGIGTIKVFDTKSKRGVIVPREVSMSQVGGKPVYFEAPKDAVFRVGQLVQFVVDNASSEPVAKDVAVLSESA